MLSLRFHLISPSFCLVALFTAEVWFLDLKQWAVLKQTLKPRHSVRSIRKSFLPIDVSCCPTVLSDLHNLHLLTGAGFGWANFDFGGGGGENEEGGNQRRAAKMSVSCNDVQQDLREWIDTFKAKGPVSKFIQRQVTCVCLLGLLYLVRAAARRLQMHMYPDDPPPPDMAFPGWEGPGTLCCDQLCSQCCLRCDILAKNVATRYVTTRCVLLPFGSICCTAFRYLGHCGDALSCGLSFVESSRYRMAAVWSCLLPLVCLLQNPFTTPYF